MRILLLLIMTSFAFANDAEILRTGTREQKSEVLKRLWETSELSAEVERAVADFMFPYDFNLKAPLTDENFDPLHTTFSEMAINIIANQPTIQTDYAKAKILEVLDNPIPGIQPKRFSISADRMHKKNYRVGMALVNRAYHANWTRGRLFALSHKFGLHKGRLRKVLERAALHDPHPYDRWNALEGLAANQLVRPDFIPQFLDKQRVNQPARQLEYARSLLATAKAHREKNPAVERLAVEMLRHPHAEFRSQAIDLLREWGSLKNEAAAKALNAMIPELSGYPLNAARELLINSNAARPPRVSSNDSRPRIVSKTERHADRIYRKLMDDMFAEVDSFEMPQEEKEKILALKHVEFGPKMMATLAEFRWATRKIRFPVKELKFSDSSKAGSDISVVNAPGAELQPDYLHSMPDFDDYLKNRIGPELVKQIRRKEVKVQVYAGTPESFAETQKIDEAQLVHFPSPYAEWGIEKYIDHGTEPPTVHFIIPPFREYAQHYDEMLRNVGSRDHKVLLNERDRSERKKTFDGATKDVLDQLRDKPSIVALGYEHTLPKLLAERPEWEVIKSEKLRARCDGCELSGTYLEFRHKELDLPPTKMLLLTSDKTLWGEGSAFLAEGIVRHNPQLTDFWFFGSAGAPGIRNIYGASIPDHFVDRNGRVLLTENTFLFNTATIHPYKSNWRKEGGAWRTFREEYYERRKKPKPLPTVDGLPPVDEVAVYFHTVHGQSFSPAEQTREQVSKLYTDIGVHSVDVETQLVAEVISRWNLEKPERSIAFGAGHVLTDIPASRNRTFDSGHSLSSTSKTRKDNARAALLSAVLDSFEQRLFFQARKQGDKRFGWTQSSGVNGSSEFLFLGEGHKGKPSQDGCGETLESMIPRAGDLWPRYKDSQRRR